MLVVSACNYSESVTDWAFGTQDAFVAATKKWLAANGMTHTTMVESTGIDARNQSTTSDLIALGKLAMANPAIAKIVAMPNTNIAGFDSMSTTNDLLGTAGVNGIKTGNLLDTGYNLLYSAIVPAGKAGDLTVIGVVLGGGSRESVDNDVKGMLASVSGGFHEVELGKAGDQVGTYSTPWGKTSPLVLRAGAQVFTWSDTPITAKLSTSALRTGQAGEKVGSISWASGKNTVIVDVVLQRAITQPSPGWRLTHPFELGK